jgi:hypothetical protein
MGAFVGDAFLFFSSPLVGEGKKVADNIVAVRR